MNAVATVVVNFGESSSSESGNVIAEWDDTRNLDASGEVKTQFVPGDVLFLLVHHDADIEIEDVKATAGTITAMNGIVMARQQEISFGLPGDDQQLTYNPAGSVGYNWKGRSGLGAGNTGKKITISGGHPCLAIADYSVQFTRYRLQTPGASLAADETFPLRIYIYYRPRTIFL